MPLEPTQVERILSSVEVFGTGPEARDLVAQGELSRIRPGEHLLEEGDPSTEVFMLLEGLVGVFYSDSDGRNVLVKVFGPPAVFGEMELPFQLPRMEYVEALEEALVARWPGQAFLQHLQRTPDAAFSLFKDVAKRLCISAHLERALAFRNVETRTAGLLLALWDAKGGPRAGEFPLRITYGMLARCLGATEKSVERTFSGWMKEGWLERRKGRYVIAEPEKLREKADPDLLLLYTRLGREP